MADVHPGIELEIGRRIRAARKALGLRQSDLADRVGISGSHLSDIERGALMPTIPTLRRLCDALGRPLEYALVEQPEARALGTVIYRMSLEALSAQRFAELVAEKTAQQVSIRIYHQAVPGEIYDQVRGLADGSIHLLIDDLLSLEHYAPLCGVVFQPFFFDDAAHYHRFLASPLFKAQVRDRLLGHGIRLLNPLTHHPAASSELLFSTFPVFTPDDLRDRRWRTYASDVAIALRKRLGAVPVHTFWNDSAERLRNGDIEAFLMPAHHHASIDLHTAARYATLLDYGYAPGLVIAINEHEYQKLSPDVQAVLAEAVEETEAHFCQAVEERANAYIEDLPTRHGVAVIRDNPRIWRSRFQEALRDVCLIDGHLDASTYEELHAL